MALCPGRRRSSSCWIAPTSTASPGGNPSTSTPTAGPCDSPNVVTRNSRPNVEDTSGTPRALRTLGKLCTATLRALGKLGAAALRFLGECGGTLRPTTRPVRAARRPARCRLELGDRLLAVRLVRGHEALELVEVVGPDVGARVGDQRLDPLPRHDVLARVVEEQLRVQHLAVHERAEQLPVR